MYSVGNSILFGKYEQDKDLSNGPEDIEWTVLDKQDGKLLVISRYALDAKRYNAENTDITWEKCTLRKWLNTDFYDSAFSDEEKSQVLKFTVIFLIS